MDYQASSYSEWKKYFKKDKKKAFLAFVKTIIEISLAVAILLLYATNIAQNYLGSVISNDSHWAWACFLITLMLSIIYFPATMIINILSRHKYYTLDKPSDFSAWANILLLYLGILIVFGCITAFFLFCINLLESYWWVPGLAINILVIIISILLIKSSFSQKDIVQKAKLNTVLSRIDEKTSFCFDNIYQAKYGLTLSTTGKSLVIETSLLKLLSEDELEAAIMHEVFHAIKRHSLRFQLLAIVLTASIWLLIACLTTLFFKVSWTYQHDNVIWLPLILACYKIFYFASEYILNAISRKQEYDADAHAVENANNPQIWLDCLIKIQKFQRELNPLAAPIPDFLTAHPAIENRIERIKKIMNKR